MLNGDTVYAIGLLLIFAFQRLFGGADLISGCANLGQYGQKLPPWQYQPQATTPMSYRKLFDYGNRNLFEAEDRRFLDSIRRFAVTKSNDRKPAWQYKPKTTAATRFLKLDDYTNTSPGEGQDVIRLTDYTFEKLVLDSKEPWIVEFYASWCRYCQMLAPLWAEAATKMKGTVNFGVYDAHNLKKYSRVYNIKGYPTILYFSPASGRLVTDIPFDDEWAADDLLRVVRETAKSDLQGKPGSTTTAASIRLKLPEIVTTRTADSTMNLTDATMIAVSDD